MLYTSSLYNVIHQLCLNKAWGEIIINRTSDQDNVIKQ